MIISPGGIHKRNTRIDFGELRDAQAFSSREAHEGTTNTSRANIEVARRS